MPPSGAGSLNWIEGFRLQLTKQTDIAARVLYHCLVPQVRAIGQYGMLQMISYFNTSGIRADLQVS